MGKIERSFVAALALLASTAAAQNEPPSAELCAALEQLRFNALLRFDRVRGDLVENDKFGFYKSYATHLSLPGWLDCEVRQFSKPGGWEYGCSSKRQRTAADVQLAALIFSNQVKTCLGQRLSQGEPQHKIDIFGGVITEQDWQASFSLKLEGGRHATTQILLTTFVYPSPKAIPLPKSRQGQGGFMIIRIRRIE